MTAARFCQGVYDDGKFLAATGSLEDVGDALLRSGAPPVVGPDHQNTADFELPDGVDPNDLGAAGWGVIFAQDTPAAVREALAPLLVLRREQATALADEGYRELEHRGEKSKGELLRALKVGNRSLVDPSLLPYYLLLVGGPDDISLDFQQDLDIAYAVGRIHFDTVEGYARYAESVVAAERRERERRATLFGVVNGDEANTHALVDGLIGQVADQLESGHRDWSIERILGHAANKQRLQQILASPPALLFTAGHGLCLRDERQGDGQGAIVCSDWSGTGAVYPEACYAATDVDPAGDLCGTIVFQFACFSAGTPNYSDLHGLFENDPWVPPAKSFVAGLPKRWLSLEGGRGALAAIGHVDRIFRYTFLDEETGVKEDRVLEQTLSRLLDGHRAGYALEPLNRWHADHAVELAALYARRRRGEPIEKKVLARTWLTQIDAKNFTLLGDPAVRLRTK